ncbi:branched-chain amino acid ABC transporter permease [Leucobacter coleopterorum]|uniref:branched-chain amino acid ABC transporter permease n=1 Tax=Leucobacter coleopterorum TaxID=2714933 RepID=UPI001FCBDC7C|nr:branched-chain amino acid ABC transporter permease [Leucobacter coleopterorum]
MGAFLACLLACTGDKLHPGPTTACLQGVIKTSAGEPAVGVKLELKGTEAPGTQQTTTDATGSWIFSIDEAGEYVVTVDPKTLPEGQFLKGQGSRTISIELFNTGSALFPLTDDASAAAPSDDGGADKRDENATTTQTPANPNQTETTSAATSASGEFSWSRLWQQAASGIRMGLLLSLAAVGLSLVYGTTGLSNFAHAEMISMGGILAFLFMSITGNIWLAGGIAVLIMAGFGWLQDAVLWKPLRRKRLSLMQLMIVSIGLSIVLQNLFQFFFGANVLRIDPSTPKTVQLFGVTLTVQSYIAMGIALVAIIGVGLALKYSRFGRATRAVSDNPALAEASGIDVNRVVRVVWIASSALAGLAGVLLGLVLNGISWNTGWQFLLLLFAAVVLGGIGTAFGAVVGP